MIFFFFKAFSELGKREEKGKPYNIFFFKAFYQIRKHGGKKKSWVIFFLELDYLSDMKIAFFFNRGNK